MEDCYEELHDESHTSIEEPAPKKTKVTSFILGEEDDDVRYNRLEE